MAVEIKVKNNSSEKCCSCLWRREKKEKKRKINKSIREVNVENKEIIFLF